MVTEQNLATTSSEVLAQQGKAVRLIWKRQHELAVADGRVDTGGGGGPGMNTRRIVGLLAASALLAVACNSGSGGSPAPSVPTELGDAQGQTINVLAWPGYVEDGSTDPAVDWVTDFETETGCTVNYQIFGTSDEAYTLFSTNPEQFDVISASGDASLRLVRGGFVQPVNLDLFASYAGHLRGAQEQAVQHGRRRALRRPARPWLEPPDVADRRGHPGSHDVGRDVRPGQRLQGQRLRRPDLHRRCGGRAHDDAARPQDHEPVRPGRDPVPGRRRPAEAQKPAITQYWVDYLKQMDDFRSGNATVGTTWQIITNLLQGEDPAVPVEVVKPPEGATGWSDTWMINSKTKNLACSYAFIDHLTSPETNAKIAEWFGEAPGNSKSCALTTDPEHCTIFHADDDAFWEDVWYWQTPTEDCVDGRTDVKCKGFDDWIKAWTEIKG